MKRRSKPSALPIEHFEKKEDWARWLAKNHAASPGVWLQLAKKGSAIRSVSYDEAVEVALCFGWIDGQKQSRDEQSWLQKFTRRADRSAWSGINKQRALALIRAGRMEPPGLAAVERARRDGRWDAAYDSPGNSTVPADFRSALERHEGARKFFEALDGRNRYAILYRIQTARKAETRARKIAQFVEMLGRHVKLHP